MADEDMVPAAPPSASAPVPSEEAPGRLKRERPAKVAKKRNHPQVAAVQVMSWFGLLFTGGIVWIFAIVWAYYDHSRAGPESSTAALEAEIRGLRERLEALESRLARSEGAS